MKFRPFNKENEDERAVALRVAKKIGNGLTMEDVLNHATVANHIHPMFAVHVTWHGVSLRLDINLTEAA